MFSNDLEKAIADISKDVSLFDNIIETSIKDITNQAYRTVVDKCNNVNLGGHTGNIKLNINKTTGTISTNDAAIVFKELGTGIVGLNSPHPDPNGMFGEWKYDYNSHGEKGWFYHNKETGKTGWTRGLPASAMFYNTYAEMLGDIDKVIIAKLNDIK